MIRTFKRLTLFFQIVWRVFDELPDELIRQIRLTPWAREEYELHRLTDQDTLEQARRFWVGSYMSIAGMPYTSSGMRIVHNTENAPNGLRSWMVIDIEHLEIAAERLRGVQIEKKPYPEIIADYDHLDTLIYFDPPYVHGERNSIAEYAFEWSDSQHIEAAALLRECAGCVVVSGYACDLYRDLYEAHGWERHDKEAQTNSGGKRIESVWLSPRTVQALNAPKQATFF